MILIGDKEALLAEVVLEALRILQGAVPPEEEDAPAERFYSLLNTLGIDAYNIPKRVPVEGVD